MKYSHTVLPRRHIRRSAVKGFILGAAVSGMIFAGASHALSIAPETAFKMHCDEAGIIEAHYAEVIDAIHGDYGYFVPGYDAPPRKPELKGE